jgi:hypothetical protein
MSKTTNAASLYETEEREMTEADRIKIGAELASVDRQIIEKKEEKKNVNRAYRVALNKLEERSNVLSKQLQDGVTEDSFEVIEVHDDKRLMVQVMRKDTDRPVGGPRPMTEPEKEAARKRLQGDLPFDGEKKGRGKGKPKGDDGIVDDNYAALRDEETDPGTPKAKRSKGKGSKR